MTINYPTSLDTFTNPTATDTLDNPSHSTQHANANDAIEALETKLGTGSSTASDNTVLAGTASGATAYQTLDSISFFASGILSGSDVTLITGTAGTNTYVPQWNADGDLIDGYAFLDEDTMSSNSATALASQQSIKAYVDAQVTAEPTREFTVPVVQSAAAASNIADSYSGHVITSAQSVVFQSFVLPADFNTMDNIQVILLPDATETIDWDIFINSTAPGEAYTTPTRGSATGQTTAVTVNEIELIDVSAGNPTYAAGDVVGVQFNSNTDNLRVLGLRIKYS